jgi:hypothetical protein
MEATTPAQSRHQDRRAAVLAQIGQTGPFLEGHLSAFKRPGCAQPGWHLTFKQQGKTRTVYVPLDLVAEVKLWTRNYQRLKKLIREVTRHSLGLIRGHVASRRATSRGRASTKRKPPQP